jgi:hypothetical protein
VAILYGDEPLSDVLAVARRMRSGGRAATLVPRKKAMRRQLDQLAGDGYGAFVVFEDGAPSAERPLSSP